LEHRRVKRFYARTNKNTKFGLQIAKHTRREALLRAIKQREKDEIAAASTEKPSEGEQVSLQFTDNEPLPYTSPRVHHHISDSQRYHDDITRFLTKNCNDPAMKVRVTICFNVK